MKDNIYNFNKGDMRDILHYYCQRNNITTISLDIHNIIITLVKYEEKCIYIYYKHNNGVTYGRIPVYMDLVEEYLMKSRNTRISRVLY